ncbi:13179_t:CDS:2, partial [Ambispora gerdemannii]
MPNIENLERNKFTNKFTKPTIQAHREEILYREDIKTSFGYAIAGLTISLAIAGGVYVIAENEPELENNRIDTEPSPQEKPEPDNNQPEPDSIR